MEQTSVEMPRYRSHKVVHALKIERLEWIDEAGKARLYFEQPDVYSPMVVEAEFTEKHKPKPGGYLVVYPDGYMSWSPAAAFENGYTKL